MLYITILYINSTLTNTLQSSYIALTTRFKLGVELNITLGHIRFIPRTIDPSYGQ